MQLPEGAAGRLSHFALHRQQLLFAFTERVRLVTGQPFQRELIQLQFRRLAKGLQRGVIDGQGDVL